MNLSRTLSFYMVSAVLSYSDPLGKYTLHESHKMPLGQKNPGRRHFNLLVEIDPCPLLKLFGTFLRVDQVILEKI